MVGELDGDTTENITLIWSFGKLMFKGTKWDYSVFKSVSFLKSVNSSSTNFSSTKDNSQPQIIVFLKSYLPNIFNL